MALCNEDIKGYTKRLLLSRMRILCNHGFFGLLLMHVKYAVDENVSTAYTNGEYIVFGTTFLDDLSDSEIDFVMMHEIMHVVLQHCMRGSTTEPMRYNIASDIVVNSNILLENNMNLSSITLKKYGVSMHLAPDGKEGHLYTAEQVFDMLPSMPISNMLNMIGENNIDDVNGMRKSAKAKSAAKNSNGLTWDDHSHWKDKGEDGALSDLWVKRFKDAAQAIEIRDASNSCGSMPAFAKRILKDLLKPQTDWRTILNDFIQEEISDYSFSPPDHRFDDNPFYLPDFNEKEEIVKDILFMIDTSGSMSDEMITAAYSEIKGAIDQFGGKLHGWLGFFDAAIIEPQLFKNEEEFKIIRPAGGGGTNFHIIFEYVRQFMQENPPASIVILTDGYAQFPNEKSANGIPVLWLINNEDITPPWGKIARIKV